VGQDIRVGGRRVSAEKDISTDRKCPCAELVIQGGGSGAGMDAHSRQVGVERVLDRRALFGRERQAAAPRVLDALGDVIIEWTAIWSSGARRARGNALNLARHPAIAIRLLQHCPPVRVGPIGSVFN
jgi:hypothetical protein